MPDDREKDSGRLHAVAGSMVRNIALLTLPWLTFQLKMLEMAKAGIQESKNQKPIETFTLHELQALMMIVDPSGKWRERTDFENKLQDVYEKTVPRVIAGSVDIIEAQEKILEHLKGVLVDLKDGDKPKTPTGEKPKAPTGAKRN